MTRRKELQNDIASIRLGQLLVCALIRFPVQVLLFRSPWIEEYAKLHEGDDWNTQHLPKITWEFPGLFL